jgi:transposase
MSQIIVTTQRQPVILGVDTHADEHEAAVIETTGRMLAHARFPATKVGYERLLEWAAGHGPIVGAGIEQTGSYGAGLTRHLTDAGVPVTEVDLPHRHVRSRRGKDDVIDAEQAARKVLSGEATARAKDTTGVVEAIRQLKVARDSAVKSRTIALQQIRDLLVTGPDDLRQELARKSLLAKARHLAGLTPEGPLNDPGVAAITALSRLARRVTALSTEIADADRELTSLATTTAPTLMSLHGIGVHHAAQLLVSVGQNPDRIRSAAALCRLFGVAPVPASSGKTHRMRLHRGGDRQANRAIHMIAICRLARHQPSRDYRDRRRLEGLSSPDIIRCLKRYITRDVYQALKTDLGWT